MDLLLTLDGPGGLADRIYRQVRSAIHDGRLSAGEALPPSRELAAQLQVSRSTVTLVYERLGAEGYTEARVGAGTFVASSPSVPSVRHTTRSHRNLPATFDAPLPRATTPTAYDFHAGVPDAALFPLTAWRRHVSRELDSVARLSARYDDSAGVPALREGIAHHLGVARAIAAEPDDIVVTAGAQQAIDLLARVLVGPGDLVAVEEPGYPPVRQALEAHGARVVSLPVDAEGVDPSGIPPHTRLIYVTPSHQFPTGVVMSRRRRLALLDWAALNDAVIVEDDYDSEYRFLDRPLEPLHVLDTADTVAYVGTFSKALLPGLRIGYVIPPGRLVQAVTNARRLADWHGDLITQGALARLLATGEFAAHIRGARRAYRRRHSSITEILHRDFPDRLDVIPSSAGLHLCTMLRDAAPGTARRVRDAAAVSGVAVETLAGFCADGPREGLVLGFGAIQLDQIEDGLRLLKAAFRRVA